MNVFVDLVWVAKSHNTEDWNIGEDLSSDHPLVGFGHHHN